MGQVANCIPPVTTVHLAPAQFPQRLTALGWRGPLYLRGALPSDGPAAAIVGARAATTTGMARAHAVARHLAGCGIHVVSGGAVGIDGAAHRGSLAGGGTTTVVLGNGLDIAYPSRHAPLFRDVLAQRGGLIGMQPDGVEPRPFMFPARNPLIAALVDTVVVIEADIRSGSLLTAAASRRLGRVVAAWPGSRGCDRLIASGAAVAVESAAQIEHVIGQRASGGAPHPAPLPPRALDPIAAQIDAAIVAGARGVDAIVRHTGLTVRAVLRALPMLDQPRATRGDERTP